MWSYAFWIEFGSSSGLFHHVQSCLQLQFHPPHHESVYQRLCYRARQRCRYGSLKLGTNLWYSTLCGWSLHTYIKVCAQVSISLPLTALVDLDRRNPSDRNDR
jgi:hypothetical protein